MTNEIILTPEIEMAIKRSAVTDLIIKIHHAIVDKYLCDHPVIYNDLYDIITNQADILRDEYKKEMELKK